MFLVTKDVTERYHRTASIAEQLPQGQPSRPPKPKDRRPAEDASKHPRHIRKMGALDTAFLQRSRRRTFLPPSGTKENCAHRVLRALDGTVALICTANDACSQKKATADRGTCIRGRDKPKMRARVRLDDSHGGGAPGDGENMRKKGGRIRSK